MGILKGGATILTSEERFVYSEDPDVKDALPESLKGAGWVRASLVPEAGRDADIVTVRALDPEERNQSRNLGAKDGPADAAAYTVTRAIVALETTDAAKRRTRLKKPSETRAWVRAMAQQNWPALDLLSQVITMMTIGESPDDVHDVARRLLGYERPVAGNEEVADDGGTKSAVGSA